MMKNYRRIKKFGAAITAVAMLGTLSVGAFADETDAVQDEVDVIGEFMVDSTSEDIIIPTFVDDLAEDILEGPEATVENFDVLGTPVEEADNLLTSTQLKITDIDISKVAVAGKADAYSYSVILTYAFIEGADGLVPDVAGKQVAMVGYTFEGTAADAAAGAVTDSSLVYAVDQVDASAVGTFNIKLTSDTDAPKHVNNDDILILKIGSDAVENGGPQAVAVDLAAAVEKAEFDAVYAEPSTVAYSAASTDLDTVKTALASAITATVYDSTDKSGKSAAGYATTNWAVKSGESFTGEIGSNCVFVGDVVPNESAAGKFEAGALQVEVTVTIPALTDGTLTVTPKTVKAGATYDAGIHELIDSIKIVSGSVEDSYAVNAAAVTYEWVGGVLDTSAAGNSAQLKVTVSGASANGKFNLTEKSTTITITVAAAGLLGDVDGDGKVNLADSMKLMRATASWPEYADIITNTAADVNDDGKINMADSMVLMRHTAGWPEYATLPYKK